VGEGSDKAHVLRRMDELKVTNVWSLGAVARNEVPALLAAADICLVPLRDVPLFSTFIPSKIFEYLAAGRPVIGSVRGEAGEILREAGAVVVEPEQARALADAISGLIGDERRRADMSMAGREYVLKNFDRRHLAARYEDLLVDIVSA
jgi:glycosyltransferase involved in cell wall biosynthesis